MMAGDERNFRSYYYEKVGFRGVEEKKSLEILLKDKPLDVIKLKQFCLRFPVPSTHRNRVWKVLLGKYAPKIKNWRLLYIIWIGILPPYTDSQQWIWDQRQVIYCDLSHALEVMGHVSAGTSSSEKLLLAWLVQKRCLYFDYKSQVWIIFLMVHPITLNHVGFSLWKVTIWWRRPSSTHFWTSLTVKLMPTGSLKGSSITQISLLRATLNLKTCWKSN